MPLRISVENIDKFYNGQAGSSWKVLENISFELRQGEVICILGPSGCGKTTLLNIVAGLDAVFSGSVEGNNAGVKIGYMFQADSLLPWRTVEQNVALGLELRLRSKRAAKLRVGELLEAIGLSSYARAYPGQLSGGMRQRVALARTIAIDPEVLILDEPLAHLDFVSRGDLANLIRSYVTESQAGALIVSHSIEDAITIGDRIMVLRGRPARIVSLFEVPSGSSSQADDDRFDRMGEVFSRVAAAFSG